jgi:hypothetical protein
VGYDSVRRNILPQKPLQKTENYGIVIERNPNKLLRHENIKFEILKCYVRDLEFFMIMETSFGFTLKGIATEDDSMGFEVMLPSACSFIVEVSCHCFILHASAYMAIFKCVGCYYSHVIHT